MSLGLFGKKLGMTHVYDETGKAIAVTVVDVSDNEVTQVKTTETGRLQRRPGRLQRQKGASRVNKPAIGHFKKAWCPPRNITTREFRVEGEAAAEVGTKLGADHFATGQWVDVIGITKGKGFAGVVKRYHFGGQPP